MSLENTDTRNRIPAFDIMKGIAILLVIAGHIPGIPAWMKQWIYSFHIPLFLFLSGFFFKPGREVGTVLRKSAGRLLVPIAVTSAFILLYGVAVGLKNGSWDPFIRYVAYTVFPSGVPSLPFLDEDIVGGNTPLWFLWALFWCQLTATFLKSRGMPDYGLLLFGLAGICLDRFLPTFPLALTEGWSALLFFGTGHLFSRYGAKPWLKILCLVCWVAAFLFSRMDVMLSDYGFLPLDFLGACGGTLVIWKLSSLIESLPARLWRGLEWLGRNSMAVFCVHTLEKVGQLRGYCYIWKYWYIELPVRIVAVILITLVLSRISFTRKVFRMA